VVVFWQAQISTRNRSEKIYSARHEGFFLTDTIVFGLTRSGIMTAAQRSAVHILTAFILAVL
jgi:hypothetical protein